ncbi:glycosyl transferase family group 2-domain-containing protein [Mycena albidolilacea]|uniref:Glycosyl transferase family group 2-domain-containing protein n=1 Tax=Mycena albidolilacea TaxID=1033008 RepID=A0AAD7F2F6_9AGAR|nr:glycosyl transferase family group 2-domain-containing protein [Mycena albidolilacea]
MDYDSWDALVQYLFKKAGLSTQNDAWFKPSEENVSAGVCLRVEPGHFRVFPYENPYLVPFEAAVRALNPLVAIKVRSAAVHAALATVPPTAACIYIDADTRIQILDSMDHLPQAEKEQCGAFLRDERVLVAWSDDIDTIVPLCADFEEKLMKLVWRARTTASANPSILTAGSIGTAVASPSTTASDVNLTAEKEKPAPAPAPAAPAAGGKKKKGKWSWKLRRKDTGVAGAAPPSPTSDAHDIEKQDPAAAVASGREARPIRWLAPFYGGLGAGLALFFLASGLTTLLAEWRLDGDTTRFALMATSPFLVCVSLFFALQVISSITFLIGPVAQYHENSRYYSALKPAPNPALDAALPHVTVELPVYKESLDETITPSVNSLKKAMQTYARQGGTSSIFVHDDGLQLLGAEERERRIAFYADHNIGWVARPPHSDAADGFKRAGRFKKASNMNYGLALSLKMEAHLARLEALEAVGDVSLRSSTMHNGGSPLAASRELPATEFGVPTGQEVYDTLEDRALALAVEEVYAETGGKWRPWASNGRACRVGEIILIVDSDTIVPEDCFRDAARELVECPEVAIIQHESDVMQVAHHYFENGIAHFTRRINKCISMSCANGEVAPFVGHNAFMRWSAIQDAAFVDEDGVTKIWSESNVSEDFDMALRLQLQGYIIRWATYSDGGFKEGVSLTVDDELNRWQKYSYGCNELIFNPLKDWWHMGPITKQLRTFIWSDAPVHYKISMSSYMFSYYGIAASTILSTLNYLLLGLALNVDGFYMHSFEIWLACMVVFPAAGNVGYTILEYRLGGRSLIDAAIENATWIPFFFFFFGGMSIHLTTALLAHMFSYNMTWSATKKEVERSNFWIEVPRIWHRFRLAFIICFGLIVMMIVLSQPIVTPDWQIPGSSWAVILPLAIVAAGHILFPIVLNPWLMIFSY